MKNIQLWVHICTIGPQRVNGMAEWIAYMIENLKIVGSTLTRAQGMSIISEIEHNQGANL